MQERWCNFREERSPSVEGWGEQMGRPMKAIRFYGVDDQRVEELSVPQIRPDEVLIKVIAASMDGTDLERIHGSHSLPSASVVVEGHEYAGQGGEGGGNTARLRVGDRVTGPWGINCNECSYCKS